MLRSTKKDIIESLVVERFGKMIGAAIVTFIFATITLITNKSNWRFSGMDADECSFILAGAFAAVTLYNVWTWIEYKLQLRRLEKLEAKDNAS